MSNDYWLNSRGEKIFYEDMTDAALLEAISIREASRGKTYADGRLWPDQTKTEHYKRLVQEANKRGWRNTPSDEQD